MEKNNPQDPFSIELLDLWNEVGGQMVIEYHTAKIKPAKEDLQQIRDKGFKTDVVTVIIAEIAARCGKDETIAFIEKAEAAGEDIQPPEEGHHTRQLRAYADRPGTPDDALGRDRRDQGAEQEDTQDIHQHRLLRPHGRMEEGDARHDGTRQQTYSERMHQGMEESLQGKCSVLLNK